MRILVVGAGATGGYFGGRLAEAGRDVTFLVRSKRSELLSSQGLQIMSPHGDVTLTPQLVTAGNLAGPYDLVIVTVKAYALQQAIEDVTPAVGPRTSILPVLNGMAHLDALAARFGEDRVLGGVCFVAGKVDEDGRIVQLAEMQALYYGDRRDPDAPQAVALDPVLQGAGFDSRRSRHIESEMWDKWVALATLGALTCLIRGTVGQVEAAPGGRRFADELLAESAAVAGASGFPVGEAALERARAMITEPGSKLTSSMYRDLVGGQQIEADQIVGDLVARAGRHGIEVPLLGLAYTNLAVYQEALQPSA